MLAISLRETPACCCHSPGQRPLTFPGQIGPHTHVLILCCSNLRSSGLVLFPNAERNEGCYPVAIYLCVQRSECEAEAFTVCLRCLQRSAAASPPCPSPAGFLFQSVSSVAAVQAVVEPFEVVLTISRKQRPLLLWRWSFDSNTTLILTISAKLFLRFWFSKIGMVVLPCSRTMRARSNLGWQPCCTNLGLF
jgi:hypothetical protein